MRSIPILLSALTLGFVAAGPAQAAPRGSYVAALATPLAAPRQEIVDGVLWKCAAERCAAPSEGSRPVLVCQRVAKAFGAVARFTTPSGELSSEELSRCNGQG
jgi:hypothetical protein